MEPIVFWQPGTPEGETKLAQIKEWWESLRGKNILWQQRPLTPDQDIDQVNWEFQKFDEEFMPHQTELRGITLYWQRPTDGTERNLTPSALKLDRQAQTLDVLPESTRNYVVRITSREPVYQFIHLTHPQLELYSDSIVFKDQATMTAVEVALTQAQIQQIISHWQP